MQTSELTTTPEVNYALITPKQFCERLSSKLDEPIGITTVYHMVKEKGFPSIKIGGRFFVVDSKIDEWLQNMMSKKK